MFVGFVTNIRYGSGGKVSKYNKLSGGMSPLDLKWTNSTIELSGESPRLCCVVYLFVQETLQQKPSVSILAALRNHLRGKCDCCSFRSKNFKNAVPRDVRAFASSYNGYPTGVFGVIYHTWLILHINLKGKGPLYANFSRFQTQLLYTLTLATVHTSNSSFSYVAPFLPYILD